MNYARRPMIHFLTILTQKKELCSWLVLFLHKLEIEKNYAWGRFHFYTILKQMKTMFVGTCLIF
jgi:hypothetical protein